MVVDDLVGEQNPQIYCLSAAGHRSSLRVLKHGLSITEVANSPLPKMPTCVWTLKEKNSDKFDKFIILSFPKNTLVLLIGEKVVEVKDTNLETKKSTLLVSLLQDDSIIQVFNSGIKHIKTDGKSVEWQSETGKVTNAVCNPKQLAVSIQGGEIVYFELDSEGNLSEREKLSNLDSDVICMSIGEIPLERQRTKFARIYGYCVVSILFVHFFVNLTMLIKLFPTIGVPLPLLSYGGSSMLSFSILLFIFLKIDAHKYNDW